MKDWSLPLRKSYYTALNGNVSIEVTPVQIFQKKIADHLPVDYAIVLGNTQGVNDSTFSVWETDATIEVELIVFQQTEPGNIIEQLSDQVKTLILPTRTTTGLPAQSGFQFTSVRLDGENDIPPLQSDAKYLYRKILRFRQHIVDNN